MIGPHYRIIGQLKVMTPLHIGTGESLQLEAIARPGRPDPSNQPADIASVALDHEGKPYLAGSSIKGVLRSLMPDRLAREALFGPDKIDDPKHSSAGHAIVWNARFCTPPENISGASYADKTPIDCPHGPLGARGLFVEARTAVDPPTGVADDRKLFHQVLVAPGTKFCFALTLQANRTGPAQAAALSELLARMRAPDGIALGRGTRTGQGRVRLLQEGFNVAPRPSEDKCDATALTLLRATDEAASGPYRWRLRLACNGPYLVSDAAKVRKSRTERDTGEAHMQPLVVPNANEPRLPGASLMGALRARAAWLHRCHNPDWREDRDSIYAPDTDLTAFERLFGVTGWRGLLRIETIRFAGEPQELEAATKNITSVRLDRFSGAPIDGALFKTRAWLDPVFEVALALDNRFANLAEDDRKRVVALADDLISSLLAEGPMLGHGVNKGYGWFEVEKLGGAGRNMITDAKAFDNFVEIAFDAWKAHGNDLNKIQSAVQAAVEQEFAVFPQSYPGGLSALVGKAIGAMIESLEKPHPDAHFDTASHVQAMRTFAARQHVKAPFRFVPLNHRVATTPAVPDLNDPLEDGFSATLTVDWQVETPILVGDERKAAGGKDELWPFSLDPNGTENPTRWAIPGASIRGMLRSAMETVAFGRLWQVNRHARFGLREFQDPHYGTFLECITRTDAQKAGWLRKVEGSERTYSITPCDWGYLEIDDLIAKTGGEKSDWIKSDREVKYRKLGVNWQDENAFLNSFGFAENHNEAPRHGRSFWIPAETSDTRGFYVCSGAVPGSSKTARKEFEYVFFDRPDADSVTLSQAVWDVFETVHSKPAKNRREPDGAWAELHKAVEAGGRIPVFYVGNPEKPEDKNFSFGLTRLYRLPHKYSLGDILLRGGPKHAPHANRSADGSRLQPDFVEALFGYVHEKDDLGLPEDRPAAPGAVARRGRIAVGFARPLDTAAFELWPAANQDAITTVMGTPKPSFAPFYLKGQKKDYSAEPRRATDGQDYPQLAGRKRYLPRRRPNGDSDGATALQSMLHMQRNTARDSERIQTRLRFLRPTVEAPVFRGTIRLHNVSKAELGAVLWVLTFGGEAGGYRHMLGHAKPFGAGQVFVSNIRLVLRPNGGGEIRDPIVWRPADKRDGIADYLDHFEDTISRLALFQNKEAWAKSAPVKGYLQACKPITWNMEGSTYLAYQEAEGKQAEHFQALRQAARSDNAPRVLLPAEGRQGLE